MVASSKLRRQPQKKFSMYSPGSTKRHLQVLLEHYRCNVLRIEEQLGNQGGWTVTLKGESIFSTITDGEQKQFEDTADPQFYWSVGLCYPTREKTRQASKHQVNQAPPSFPRGAAFPSLGGYSSGGPSSGGSRAPDVQNWVNVANGPPPETESLSTRYALAMHDLADKTRKTAEAMKQQKAALFLRNDQPMLLVVSVSFF